ncbi:hypothetical protein Tco_1263767 [Tanacetum coccineum]
MLKSVNIKVGEFIEFCSKDLSKVGSNKWYQSLLRVSHKKNIPRSIYSFKMAGSDNDSDDASVHSEATIPQQQQNIQPQIITTVSNNNAKFPYLKKDEYEVWAMKMEYWITNNDMNIWKVIQNGNSLKRTRRDRDGRVIILPPTTADEHIAVQRESKARTTLLQSIPDDHVADFHYMDDARDIWNAIKARFGGNAESKKMRKSMLKQEFSEFQKLVALTLKTKGGLELLSFDDLYYKLKTLEVDIKGYSTFSLSQSAGPSHSAFVSTTSASKKMSYADSPSYTSSTYTVPSNSKTGSHRSGNVIEDVLQSFVADTEPEQQLAYEDFDQIEKLDLEEMDLKWQMAMLSVRVHKFEQKAGRKIDFDKKNLLVHKKKIQKIRKKEEDSKALITVDTLVDWTEHDGQSDGVITPKEFGMIAGCDTEDAIGEGAAKIYNLLTGADTKKASTAGDAGEFALMGVTSERVLQKNQLTLEDKIKVLSIELENTTNLLKHYERINSTTETAKKELQTELDNHLVQIEKWETSSKNLFRLIDSSMSVRTKVGLGFSNYISENELGLDDSAFSVFTTNSEEVEGRPLFNRFAKTDSMKVVPPPLSRDYTPLSDHIDLDESQMSYGTKSSTSGDSNSVSNDFVSCDNSDKSSEVNTNDFASSDSSVKSLEPKSNDSTSCASTSSVSTSESEAEIESNVGTPIQEPIIVQELPSFSCTDKDVKTSRTPCNKNGYFNNKKASHFRKNNSSASKSCFVCGSYLHLIKDCNYYETQYPNDFDGVGYPQREPIWDNATRVTQSNQFVPQAVLLRSGKVSIPAARPNQVPAGRPKPVSTGRPKPVSTGRPKPVSTGKQNRPPPVHAGRRNSSSVTSGWWQSTARPMTHLPSPTSSYFQTYTPYVPQMYYNHMQYGGVRWATAVKPSAGCSWKTHRKGLYWENSYTDAEDEGIFDSGCSRSMTGPTGSFIFPTGRTLPTADDGGIDDLPIADIYSVMDNLGYVTDGKLNFYKNKFSPQWRFLVHTILHCLSTKSGSWDQFGSSIAVALICLSDRRKFNWSSYIFKGMVSNIGNAKKVLMYPRFLQTILAIETSNTTPYKVFKLSSKLFANMRLNFEGQPMPLLAAMLSQAGEGAGVDTQAVPPPIPETISEPLPESDQPQDHVSTPPRPPTSDPFTSTNVEDEPLGGSFHASPPRSTPASPAGHTSGGAEDPITLTALSAVVSTLVQKVHSLETELKAHKQLFKDVVGKLVKQVKAMEVKLKTKKRKVVMSDSNKEDKGEQDVGLDALNALANAAVTIDSTKSPGGPSSNPAACSYDPTSVVPNTDVPTNVPIDVPSGVAPTGPSTVSPDSTNVPTSSSIPAAEPIPARSGTTTTTPSSPVRDARKGKGVAVEEPTPTQDKTFKQLEEERLGWEAAQRLQAQKLAYLEKQRAESLMKDANLARQMSQDFEMTGDQRKRQQEVLASAANYSDAAWDIILARLQANPDLSSIIFGVDFTDDDFAAKMVALVNSQRKELAEQRAQE